MGDQDAKMRMLKTKNGFWVAKQGFTHEKVIRPIWSPKSVIFVPICGEQNRRER